MQKAQGDLKELNAKPGSKLTQQLSRAITKKVGEAAIFKAQQNTILMYSKNMKIQLKNICQSKRNTFQN